MIISKVIAFDLSNVDINQRELHPQRTFGTIQKGENTHLNFNPISPLVNNKLFFFFFLLIEQPSKPYPLQVKSSSMVVVVRQSLAEQVGSTRQQRDLEDSIDESLSSLSDAIVIVMSLLYARVERLVAILSGLGYC